MLFVFKGLTLSKYQLLKKIKVSKQRSRIFQTKDLIIYDNVNILSPKIMMFFAEEKMSSKLK